MGQVINYTRLTTSDKLDDRFLTCQVYEPVDPEQVKSGMIFSQIEILNPWFPTSQIGQTVINTLIREYYRGNDTSDLVNFENAVKKVNEALAQIAQNGETDWIGKFSGILALVNKDEIHIAQTGQSQAYLFRGSKANHITEGLGSNEPPHPLKTFTNLTSGNLQEGDKIIIGNSTLFAVYSPSELKIPISSYRPTLSAIEIARGLKRHGAQNGNAIIIELTTKDELANIPPEQKLDTIYLDKRGFDLTGSLKSLSTMIAPIFSKAGRGISRSFQKSKESLGPKIRNTISASKKKIGNISLNTEKAEQNTDDYTARENIDEPENQSVEQSSPRKKPLINTGRYKKTYFIKTFLKLKNRLRRILIATGLYQSNKSKMIASIIYLVVTVLIITIGYTLITKTNRVNEKKLREKSAQITSLSGEASVALSKEDEKEAVKKYLEILRLSEEIKGSKYEDDTKEITERAKTKVKEISRLTTVESSKKYGIDESASGFTNVNDNFIYYKKQDGIYFKKASESGFNLIISQKIDSPILSASQITGENKVAILLANKKIKTIDIGNKQIEDQSAEIEGGVRIRDFLGNLYILDPSSNQIWKSTNEDGKYNTTTKYIKDDTVVDSAVDIAIDGSIYVLSRDCLITKLSRGNKNAEYKITLPADQDFANCKKIASSESSSSIFVANKDGGGVKIVEIKKNGDFVGQFYLNGSNSAEDVFINIQRREIIIQANTEIIIYKI